MDILLGSHPNPVWSPDFAQQPYAERLMDDFKKARAIVRARIEVAQLKQAECYDASLGNLIFKKKMTWYWYTNQYEEKADQKNYCICGWGRILCYDKPLQ